MSSARKQLLERFRASAIERLHRCALDLGGPRNQAALPPALDSVRRELHTIKGEARLLGLPSVSGVIHEIEQLLHPEWQSEGELHGALKSSLQHIDQLVRVLADMPLEESLLRGPLSPQALEAEAEAAEPEVLFEAQPMAGKGAAQAEKRWVHVDLERIDKLCDGTAELETTFRALFAHAQTTLSAQAPSPQGLRALREDFERYRAQFDDVTSMVWALRLVPIEPLLVELAYHADELARSLNKRVYVRVHSGSAQLERGIFDTLREPLLHLVRNAIDHGIEDIDERGEKPEEASLDLHAESHGASVIVTIADDGRGIDLEKVRTAAVQRGLLSATAAAALSDAELYALVFQHGFSTRSEVTELSGRGVGLDVVRSAVESLGGTVEMTTGAGAGTIFRLTLPMRLSRERALVFGYEGVLYAIPARQVLDLVNLRDQTVREVVGGTALWCRDSVLPLSSMAVALGIAPARARELAEPLAVILSTGGQRWAFTLGGVAGDFELLRKPCDALLTACLGYVASATLDDGQLVLYLNSAELLLRAQKSRAVRPQALLPRRRRVLVVDDSAIIRHLLSLVLSAGGYEVTTADNGREALARCEDELPELIVSDLDMPEMDGMELLGRVRGRWPELPVIIFTNHDSSELRLRAQSLGASEYVVKADFEQEAVLHAVERVLLGRAARA